MFGKFFRSACGGCSEVLADREQYSANALAYAQEHLTLDRMVDGLEAAIRHAI